MMIIPEHKYSIREKTVVDILKKAENIHSFINVGFHNWEDPRRHWWIKICETNNIDWNILEIFEHNVAEALKGGCPSNKIQLGDIMDLDNLKSTDCLLFWHGPEHINKELFKKIIPELEKKYKLLIFGMPLGNEPQGEAYGNPHEIHVSDWYREDWEDIGYTVIEVHDTQKYPHITVYKYPGV